MSRRRPSRGASALRACPICASAAVSAAHEETEGLDGRYFLRCGQCHTWRSLEIGFWAARRLEGRLRRDRRRMARALRHLNDAGSQPDLRAPARG